MIYPNIQISNGMAGWFAVMIDWNPEHGGFPEPECTGQGRYALQKDAIREAEDWAENEGLPFYLTVKIDETPARQDVAEQFKEMGFTVMEIEDGL
jgi:hypothetical protein